MQKSTHKKGTIQSLQATAIGIAILAIIVVVVVQLLAQIATTQTADTVEYNLTTQAITALAQYGVWFGIIILVSIAVVMIYIIRRGLGSMQEGA